MAALTSLKVIFFPAASEESRRRFSFLASAAPGPESTDASFIARLLFCGRRVDPEDAIIRLDMSNNFALPSENRIGHVYFCTGGEPGHASGTASIVEARSLRVARQGSRARLTPRRPHSCRSFWGAGRDAVFWLARRREVPVFLST